MAETRAQLREAADSSWTPYDRDASGFDARYGSVSFAEVHRELIPWLPRTRGAALDVGAGNGRDAVAIARQGGWAPNSRPMLGYMRTVDDWDDNASAGLT